MVFGPASQLGVGLFEDPPRLELIPGRSQEEVETIIRAVYRQVLGNAHLMESERLTVPESQLRNTEITVREFVRQVAKSELYWSRFFDNCPRYRSIELNFKHLLGRAPESYEEMEIHSQILDQGGYQAEIDSYVDGDEYLTAFGEYIVPFYQGYKTQTGRKVVGFTHLFQLLRGGCSSDRSSFVGTRSRLQRSLLTNTPSVIIPLSSAPAYEKVAKYQSVNDANQLIAQVLGLKLYPSVTYGRTELPNYPKAEVLKPKLAAIPTSVPLDSFNTQVYQDLQRKCEEQEKRMETLQQQLAELQPFALIGSSVLSKWQAYSPTTVSESKVASSFSSPPQAIGRVQTTDSYQMLLGLSKQQQEAIASLESQITELRSLATIGEARLNKWRSRTFSS